ncbi:MAG TPA: vitamin B12 dependent-methionine synthase activation domain-containing protein, partial [Bacteroidota bacterium]|nr:vitamin B12 dependent-methionine synthase activation domain-containing protein [Bacteroidota bacterium]
NLQVMNERGVLPHVILGGAALTRRYVEQDLRQIYKGNVMYANDAFDGLHYMEKITSGKADLRPTDGKTKKIGDVAEEEELILSGFEAKIASAPRQSDVVAKKSVSSVEVPKAPFYGTKVVEDIFLDEIFYYINEVALIRGQWRVVRGKMAESEYQNLLKQNIYPDFDRLKKRVKKDKLLVPKVVYGYFPCQSEGNDLIIYKLKGVKDPVITWNYLSTPTRTDLEEWLRFTFPRQEKGRFLCISDFFASRDSDRVDVVAFHLVTMGNVASEHSKVLYESNKYKEYLYFHGLSVESAEALAELWHKKIREELNIHQKDSDDVKKLFSQHFRGSRYSFGYPACPALEDQEKLFKLLRPERIGVTLTEEYQLVPEQSTSAIIVHHPEARYFNI